VTAQDEGTAVDPAGWGESHVNRELPIFEDGNTCLFCHRHGVGDSWNDNAHQRTISEVTGDGPAGSGFVLGDGPHRYFLRRGAGYGKLDIGLADGGWDSERFGQSCVGCHASGADSEEQTFAALAVDCFMCHGVADPAHTDKPELMLLSNQSATEARVVISICAACHIRTGTSRSTGLSYPNRFVAGDNVFVDFRVDLSEDSVAALPVGERHIYENVRDIVVLGDESVSCISCHDVHPQSAKKHENVERTDRCFTCHHETGPMRETRAYERHSALCGY
jgi:hypothetical protein